MSTKTLLLGASYGSQESYDLEPPLRQQQRELRVGDESQSDIRVEFG